MFIKLVSETRNVGTKCYGKNGKHGQINVCLELIDRQKKPQKTQENQQISQHTPGVVSLRVLLYYLGRISLPTRFRAMLKMAPGTGRQRTCLLLHHLVITWRGPKDGAIDLLCQTQQIALQSPVWLSDYSARCCGDKSCWKLRSCP